MDLQCGHFLVKMYVKMKELGPIGGRAPENFVCRFANADLRTKLSERLPPPPTRPNSFVLTYIFAKKHLCRKLTPPSQQALVPQREILDPPLILLCFSWGEISQLIYSEIIHIYSQYSQSS